MLDLTWKDVARFWSKVDVRLSDNECWCWKWGTSDAGYGLVNINGKSTLAHRVALMLSTGQYFSTLKALHSCDNPPCCNPNHLRWGTDLDNHKDAVSRNRHKSPPVSSARPPVHYGSDNNQAIMTEEKVRNLRLDRANGIAVKELTSKYEISKSTVYQILRKETWSDID